MDVRTTVAATITVGLLASGLALAPSASARSGGGAVKVSGDCSTRGIWKLKAKADDGRLEVEGEVDVNRVGQHWTWTIARNGTVVRRGSATTSAPSGSFGVERKVTDGAGQDKITFRATNRARTNTCYGALSA